jgi:undecaprenyl-diphosphatase
MFQNLIHLLTLSVAISQQLVYGVILGIVQGVSEWLPISSKTQIIIASEYLFNFNFNQAYTFGLFMEIGTVFASIIYFRKEVVEMIRSLLGRGEQEGRSLLKFVIVSTIFTGILGSVLYLAVDSLQGTYSVGLPMIIVGVILIGDALFIKYSRSKYGSRKNRRTVEQLGLKDYAAVGIAQGIAALPGVSRSGATTSALLLLNVETDEAFRLSFIDMILATTGAILLTWFASRAAVSASIASIGLAGLAVSILVATAISLVLIRFLLGIAKKSSIVYLTAALGVIALLGGALVALI